MSPLHVGALAAVNGLALAPVTLRLVTVTQTTPRAAGSLGTISVTVIIGMLVSAVGQPVVAPLVVLAVAAAVVDLEERRLPNVLTSTLAASTALVVFHAGSAAVGRALAGAVCALAAAIAAKLVNDGVLGWGDIKLLPSLAALLMTWRPDAALVGLAYATALLAVTVVLFGVARAQRGDPVPYGPALVVGAFAALPAVG